MNIFLSLVLLNTLNFTYKFAAADELPQGAACASDRQCASKFCDTGKCAQPEGILGAFCKPAPRTSEGPRDGKLHMCGAYLCLEDRCRSCQTDEECQSELGAPRCVDVKNHPGQRCGR